LKILLQMPLSQGKWNTGWGPWRSTEALAAWNSIRKEWSIVSIEPEFNEEM
jgi:hypothetical protein